MALDAEPLPDEEFDWTGVLEEIHFSGKELLAQFGSTESVSDRTRCQSEPAGIDLNLTSGSLRAATLVCWSPAGRGYRDHDRIRLTWRPSSSDHETIVKVVVRPNGPGWTMLRFH